VQAQRGGPQRIPRPPFSRAGASAPWADLAPADRRVDLTRLRVAFAGRGPGKRSPVEVTGVRASSVLAPLYEDDGVLYVVLTRRAQHLRTHRGEVSFPGGAKDPGESIVEAALREAREEIGLDASTVEVIGELDHLTTVTSRSFIVPHVGLLPGRPHLEPNPHEVEAVLHVPVDELLLDEVFREERWGIGPVERPIWFFDLVGDTIWGATASMLRQLLAIATGTEA